MIYTIGFTKSTAEHFFERLRTHGVEVVLDVRLKTNSQLAGFAKTPDIEYFVRRLIGAEYIHDEALAPSEEILSAYRKKEIDWAEYTERFEALMAERCIDRHILLNYSDMNERTYCLLCSEESAECCHRSLAAQRMAKWFGAEVVHL